MKLRTQNSELRTLAFVAAAALVGAAAAPAHAQAPPEKIALRGGRIITNAGPDIERGVILINRGRIVDILSGDDADSAIPYDYMEVDYTGKVLMPGMINPHDWGGLDIANENLPVTPFLDVYDSIDPSRSFFEESLRDGVTTVHMIAGNNTVVAGLSRALRPIGMTVEEMTVMPAVALKLSASPRGGYDRMRQSASLRETFRELDDYLERLAERRYEEQLKRDGREIDVLPAEATRRGRSLIRDTDYDDQHLNLVRLRRGDLAAFIWCGAATDVRPAIELATEQGFLDRCVFVLGGDAHRAVREIARTGRPVVLPSDLVHRDRDPDTGRITETFIPKVFDDAGVTFALQPNASGSMAERYLNYQAAMCVRHGISRETALKSISLTAAEMIGLGERIGSLEPGKTANIVIMSGDPFDFNAWVEHVYIDGVHVYDRSEDPRLQRILETEVRAVPHSSTNDDKADESDGEGGE